MLQLLKTSILQNIFNADSPKHNVHKSLTTEPQSQHNRQPTEPKASARMTTNDVTGAWSIAQESGFDGGGGRISCAIWYHYQCCHQEYVKLP